MFSYLPWVLSGGAIVWIALALLAPSLLAIVTPFIKYGLDALAEYIRTVWEGFKYVFDRSSAVVFLLSAVVLSYWYGHVNTIKHVKKTHTYQIEKSSKQTPSKKSKTDSNQAGWAN